MTLQDLDIRQGEGFLTLRVRVQPRARKTAIAGIHDGALKLQLTAPPVGEKANRQLLGFLARILGLPGRHLALTQGAGSRRKTVRIEGLERAQLLALLTQYLV